MDSKSLWLRIVHPCIPSPTNTGPPYEVDLYAFAWAEANKEGALARKACAGHLFELLPSPTPVRPLRRQRLCSQSAHWAPEKARVRWLGPFLSPRVNWAAYGYHVCFLYTLVHLKGLVQSKVA